MKCSLLLFIVFLSFSSLAQVDQRLPNNRWAYYGEDFYLKLAAKTLSKDEIARILNSKHSSSKGKYDVVGSCVGNCYSHVSLGYSEARRVLFGQVYILNDNQGQHIQDVYCGKKFHFSSIEDAMNRHSEVNTEHTWPQSKFSSRHDKGQQKSDMHHLFLTDSDANNRRANHEFGKAGSMHDELNVDDCEISKLVVFQGAFIFEPPKAHRGNVARALFYFSTHYGLAISRDQEKAIREWHNADPVDEMEIARHELIARHQKVRNPFVDHPELMNVISDF